MKFFKIFALLFLVITGPAFAEDALFFSVLRDVPLMKGFAENYDDQVVFDKPQGRIIESSASAKNIEVEHVYAFYQSALPQLGWKRLSGNSYVREMEKLVVDAHVDGKVTQLHIKLMPFE